MQKYLTITFISILLISISIYRNYEENLMTSVFFYIILGTSTLIIIHHLFTTKKHSTEKANINLVYYILWFISFGMAGIIHYYFYNKRSISNFIVASSDTGLTRTQLNLKSDKSYVLMSSTFLGKSYMYGSYSIINDTVIIDKIPQNSDVETNTLIITKDLLGGKQFSQLGIISKLIDTNLIELTFDN